MDVSNPAPSSGESGRFLVRRRKVDLLYAVLSEKASPWHAATLEGRLECFFGEQPNEIGTADDADNPPFTYHGARFTRCATSSRAISPLSFSRSATAAALYRLEKNRAKRATDTEYWGQ